MGKFKISFLCILLAVAMTTSLFSLKTAKKSDSTFKNETDYVTTENLAIDNKNNSVRKLTDGNSNTVLMVNKKSNADFIIDLGTKKDFNCVVLKEKGLNVKSFSIMISDDNATYTTVFEGDKIEYHRLCTFDTVNARYIKIFVGESDSFVKLKEIEIYNQPNVNSENFRMTGYIINSDFYTILQDEKIASENKKAEIQKMLQSYNFAGLTHVNFYCGISFDKLGNVYVGDKQGDQTKNVEELVYMMNCMREFGNKNLKITYVVSAGSVDENINYAMGENSDKFATNLIQLGNKIGADGIDFDYEFPQTDYDYKTFGDFLIKLKGLMKTNLNPKENSILSCAFGTRDINYPQQVIDSLDIVNMMTYDIFDQDGEHSSFWSCAVQGAKYLEDLGFKKEQINIGIPFYGTQNQALMEQYIYKNADSFNYYDNYYTFGSYYQNIPTEVYFNSPAMVRDKTAYALLNNYGGIMVWHFSCDTDYSSEYSLWRAAYKAVEQFGGAK